MAMYPPVVQLESQRRELARTLGLADDAWASRPVRERERRQRPRAWPRPLQTKLRPPVADEG